MKVLFISQNGLSIKSVSKEEEINLLLSNSLDDDVIPNYVDLDRGLTLIYNDGCVDPKFAFKNTLTKKLVNNSYQNFVVICRYIYPDDLDELTDILPDDVDFIKNKLWG